MSDTCCGHSHKDKKPTDHGLRTSLMCLYAIAMMIPSLERILTAGRLGYINFVSMTALSGHSLFFDFTLSVSFQWALLFSAGLLVFSSLVTGQITPLLLATTSMISMATLLFSQDKPLETIKNYFSSTKAKISINSFFAWPSSEKTMSLFVVLNWCMSLTHILFPTRALFANTLHDALLTLGIHNAGNWFKNKLRSVYESNHEDVTFTVVGHGTKKVKDLKKGDIINIDKKSTIPTKTQITQIGGVAPSITLTQKTMRLEK